MIHILHIIIKKQQFIYLKKTIGNIHKNLIM